MVSLRVLLLFTLLVICHLPGVERAVPRRHLILVVLDGSQYAHEVIASHYLEGRTDGLVPHAFPYAGLATTWDLGTMTERARAGGIDLAAATRPDPQWGFDPAVEGTDVHPRIRHPMAVEARHVASATDSAAAATALSTGAKTVNGRIAWGPQPAARGRRTTLWEQARSQGRAIGVVSSVGFSHATPAAFVAHHPNRGAYHELAHEMLFTTRPEVIIGAGHPDPDADGTAEFRWLQASDWQQLGRDPAITFVGSGPEALTRLQAATAESIAGQTQLVGIFGSDPDRSRSGSSLALPEPRVTADGDLEWALAENDILLADAAEAALRRLATDPEGFALMIEAGDIDWVNHADDLRGLVRAWAAADNMLGRVVALVAGEELPGVTPANTLVIVTSDHGNGLVRLRPGYAVPKGQLPRVAQVPLAQHWLTPWPAELDAAFPALPDGSPLDRHTNELVTVYAWGAGLDLLRAYEGAWYPGTTLLDHVHLHAAMAAFLQLGPAPVRPLISE